MTLESKTLSQITRKDIHAAGGYCRCGQKVLILAERGPDAPRWVDLYVKCGNVACDQFIHMTVQVSK